MAKIRIKGDTSGYVDLSAPNTASSSTLDLDQLPQKNVTNTFSADMSFGDNNKVNLGTGNDLQLYHDGSNNYIKSAAAGWLNVPLSGNGMTVADSNFSNIFFKIDSSGRVTKPQQPVFRATNGSSATGSNSVIIFTQKDFDVSNSYNTGTGAFTAPATGHYLFYVAGLYNVNTTSPTWKVSFYKNNSQDSVLAEYQSSLNSNGYNVLFNGSIITHMAAGDYMQIYNHSSNVHISGTQTKFGGYLIG